MTVEPQIGWFPERYSVSASVNNGGVVGVHSGSDRVREVELCPTNDFFFCAIDRKPDFRVIPESNRHAVGARNLHHDQIGNRADKRERCLKTSRSASDRT